MDYREAWIPIDCRLPDKEGDYIVSIESDGYKEILIGTWMHDISLATLRYEDKSKAGFVIWEWCKNGSPWKEVKNAKAWMEAPEAYG